MAAPGTDRRYTIAYLLVLLLVLAVAAALPFALTSVIDDVRHVGDRMYVLGDTAVPGIATYRVDVDITSLNDSEDTVTLRATATRACLPTCSDGARLAFVSAILRADGDLLPVQEWLIFEPGIATASGEQRLPVYGDPIRYPFDDWQLVLVIVPERVMPDATLVPLRAGDPGGGVALTIVSRVPRLQMHLSDTHPGVYPVDPSQYQTLTQSFVFERPLYLKILTVSLVLLVTAAAAYAVLLRPLDQLIINAGALILGVWGVRAILLGTDLSVVTVVDLVLMSVILFLLGIITLRALWLLEDRSAVRLFRRTRPAGSSDFVPDAAAAGTRAAAEVAGN